MTKRSITNLIQHALIAITIAICVAPLVITSIACATYPDQVEALYNAMNN